MRKGRGRERREEGKKEGRKEGFHAHGHPIKVNAAGIDALQTGLQVKGSFCLEI